MSSEKRLVLFLVLSVTLMFGTQAAMEYLGLVPKPAPKPPGAEAGAEPGKADAAGVVADPEAAADVETPPADPAKAAAEPETPAAAAGQPARPPVERVDADELVLGSADMGKANPYRMEVRLAQMGAAVEEVASSRFEAEREPGLSRDRPLRLVQTDPLEPPSLALGLIGTRPADPADSAGAATAAAGPAEVSLADEPWEVVRDDQGRAVRPIERPAGTAGPAAKGQEIIFRLVLEDRAGLTLTRSYRLFEGDDAFETTLGIDSPGSDQPVTYTLLAPHGIPIEGEWYTGTFRDVFFGQYDRGATTIVTRSAYDVVNAAAEPERFQTLPLRFAGAENQYFAAFVAPWPQPTGQDGRLEAEAVALPVGRVPADAQKADVAVKLTSRPVDVGPNRPASHTFKVYAGAKKTEALAPFGAEDLASYRKNQWFSIPGGAFVAKSVIDPLLKRIYALTRSVAQLFGFENGNYGIAIILLTMTVRMCLFPLGRKQALMAKKMQDLQPLMTTIREKYKDDKERQAKETWALYRQYKVNPAGGCLPALIQLPIFVGLWQALNNSVDLRHAQFLYIQNLAAPDMLFRFPGGVSVPWLGEYFNLLPFLVVGLMLVQTKLFSPPAITDEQKQQQQIMKFMMIFMAFMFYKVPSGLGIYFITSSLWQVCERLLLPKSSGIVLQPPADDVGPEKGGGRGGSGGNGNGSGGDAPKGWLARKLEALIEEANNDKTYRRPDRDTPSGDRDRGKGRDADRDRDRPKGNPRPKPGKRR